MWPTCFIYTRRLLLTSHSHLTLSLCFPPSVSLYLSVSLSPIRGRGMKRRDYSNRTKSYSITAQGYWLYSKLNNYVAGLQWQMCTGPHFSGVCCQQRRVIPLQLQTGRKAAAAYLLKLHTHTHTPNAHSQELQEEDRKRESSTDIYLTISTNHMFYLHHASLN